MLAPEQAGLLRQSEGLARCGRGGASGLIESKTEHARIRGCPPAEGVVFERGSRHDSRAATAVTACWSLGPPCGICWNAPNICPVMPSRASPSWRGQISAPDT